MIKFLKSIAEQRRRIRELEMKLDATTEVLISLVNSNPYEHVYVSRDPVKLTHKCIHCGFRDEKHDWGCPWDNAGKVMAKLKTIGLESEDDDD